MREKVLGLALIGATLVTQLSQARADTAERKSILFFGDSLTAGYGVELEEAYPNALQKLFDEQGFDWNAIQSGVSGETTAGGLRRVNWALRKPVDIFVLALGGNDGLRGIELSDTRKNLIDIVGRVRAKYPETRIIIAGMRMPPNLGGAYTREFEAVFPSVAESVDALLLPFLLEGVGGDPRFNQRDGIHPNREGHQRIAEHVFEFLAPILKPEN